MRVLTCPQHIHDVYASFRNGRHTRHRLSKRKFSQHMTCAVSHSVQNATSELQKLCNLIKSYAETHPTVQGSERLLKRAQSDFVFVRKLRDCSQQSNFSPPQFSTAAGQDGSLSRQLQEEQLQGVFNNIRGMKAEFAVAQQAPGVTCLGTRFYAEVSAGMSRSPPFVNKVMGLL